MENKINPENIASIQRCVCGALTICTDDGREYYCREENLSMFAPDVDEECLNDLLLEHTQCCCNHCVNHWGLDLCSCGSGERDGECDCGSKQPYQQVGAENYHSANAWF